MALRPHGDAPGRTYKWYTGKPVFPFGAGLHYTTFRFAWAPQPPVEFDIASLVGRARLAGGFLDRAEMHSFTIMVENTGRVMSDYVALLFANTTAGPQPAPRQELVAYTRVKGIVPGERKEAVLCVELGQIARVDEEGNRVLYPGEYNIWLDVDGEVRARFRLVGEATRIAAFPRPR